MSNKEENSHLKGANDRFAHALMQEYEKRKKKNPSYSLRAFAKLLGVDQSSLSKFFKGERSFAPSTIKLCLEKLNLDSQTIALIEEDLKNRSSEYQVPEEDVLKMLSHWKYWAILEFLKINNSTEPAVIGRSLGLSVDDASTCLNELTKLNFIEIENQKYRLLKPNNNWISNKKTTVARKNFQHMLLQLSMNALLEMPIEVREHGSLTVAIDKNKLPEIKEKIRAFQRDLGRSVQKKGNLNSVYQLTISFFPISTIED